MTISREYRRRLVIMVKEPKPGQVKTRLGADIGMTCAAWWFRHQFRGLIRRLRDPRWQTVIAVSPDKAGLQSRVWPGDLQRWPQGLGDLGQRMRRIFNQMPKGPVIIIGADIPAINRADIVRAFAALGNHDAVFGPATDGGYWLVGLRRTSATPPGLFSAVRWSTSHALSDSIASLAGHSIALTNTLSDVDTVNDL